VPVSLSSHHKLLKFLPKVKRPSSLRFLGVVVGLAAVVAAAQAAFEKDWSGPRAGGLGGAGVALSGDAWCAGRNPALLTDGTPLVGLAWQRLFDLPELSRLHLAGRMVLGDFVAAAEAQQFGGELYQETSLAASLARSFSTFVSVGCQISINRVSIADHGDDSALGALLGIRYHPIPEVCAAACWRNFPEARFRRWDARMPEVLQFGVSVRLPRGSFEVDVVEESRFATEYRLGAEAPVLPLLTLRVGSRFEPVRPSVGFTVRLSRWRFHYAGDLHPDLGPSHELGLEVEWP
jgi:hypothetical protein